MEKFTKYDEYAVKQINRNINLVRYEKFSNKLLMLGLINLNAAIPLKYNGALEGKAWIAKIVIMMTLIVLKS